MCMIYRYERISPIFVEMATRSCLFIPLTLICMKCLTGRYSRGFTSPISDLTYCSQSFGERHLSFKPPSNVTITLLREVGDQVWGATSNFSIVIWDALVLHKLDWCLIYSLISTSEISPKHTPIKSDRL